ncbi:hypothetical protein RYA07_28215, partial [Pseudomonas syringae pv. actinidiae]|nr:hypothetical protein [Pseudomonas syringae pv. actinidiae]
MRAELDISIEVFTRAFVLRNKQRNNVKILYLGTQLLLVYRLKINFSHACVLIATRARWIL